MDLDKYHSIYRIQADWTKRTRNNLYRRGGLLGAGLILETGCGTGVLLDEISGRTSGSVTGVDNDIRCCDYARRVCPKALITVADGLNLPFPSRTFDITICHYYLIWTSDARRAVNEMIRVTKKGGCLIAASEPDYDSSVEYPDKGLKHKLISTLAREGMKRFDIGRKVPSMFAENAEIIESGVIPNSFEGNDINALLNMDLDNQNTQTHQLFFQPVMYVLARRTD